MPANCIVSGHKDMILELLHERILNLDKKADEWGEVERTSEYDQDYEYQAGVYRLQAENQIRALQEVIGSVRELREC